MKSSIAFVGIGMMLFCAVALLPASAFAGNGGYERTASDLTQTIESAKAGQSSGEAGYDAVFRRDPMRPLVDTQGNMVTTVGFQGGLSVQGIIWSDERPLAVIDDELFAQGDTVGPYTIEKIQSDGVTVRRGEETTFIPLDRGLALPAPASAPASQ